MTIDFSVLPTKVTFDNRSSTDEVSIDLIPFGKVVLGPSESLSMRVDNSSTLCRYLAMNNDYLLVTSEAILPADATLSALGVTGQTLSPSFSGSVTSYTVTLPHGTTSATITATAADAKSTVSGTGSVTGLTDGTSKTVTVTAEDGKTTKTYTIVFNIAKSTDATLSGLSVTGLTLSPTFSSGTKAYTTSAVAGTTSVTVNATTNDSNATTTGTGAKTVTTGSNTLDIVVTAQDGTTKETYTITLTVAAA
jgi:hypothetical protein